MDLTFLENEVVHHGRISIKHITEEISSSPSTRFTNHWAAFSCISWLFNTQSTFHIEKTGSSLAPYGSGHMGKQKMGCHWLSPSQTIQTRQRRPIWGENPSQEDPKLYSVVSNNLIYKAAVSMGQIPSHPQAKKPHLDVILFSTMVLPGHICMDLVLFLRYAPFLN